MGGVVDRANERIARLGLSPRQQRLNFYYSHYRGQCYDARAIDWDGTPYTDQIDREAIARATFTPPGYYDAGAQWPLKFRRPTAPYSLCKVIVDRFTGLLFSERRHPQLRDPGDLLTEDYVRALAESARLWPAMIQARTFGGACGSVAVGFQLVEGRPVVEPHDPRWIFPQFDDRAALKLKSIEKRYIYPEDRFDPELGKWVEVNFWYRRIIDADRDILWDPVFVGEGDEPDWERLPAKVVEHGLGFCPVVWVQNMPVADDVDGDPDCHCIYDTIESIDALIAQANRGTLANCFGRETPFVTDRGVRRFNDFASGDKVRVLSHAGVWRPATVRNFGKQALWAVTLTRGGMGQPLVVRATRDHRWLLADGETTDRVEVGDRLLSAPATFSEFEYDQAPGDERSAWVGGFVWGDGSADRGPDGKVYGSRLRLCGEKTKYAYRFAECGFKVWAPETLNGDLSARSEMRKELPDLATVPLNILRAFVRGYLDADGSKRKRIGKASRWNRIQATGQQSIDFIRQAFPAVGLYISAETDMTGSTTNYGPRTAVTVRFEINENGSDHPSSLWRVAAVEPLNVVEEVWCLEVEEDHSFSLPFGVATRNCDPTLVISSPNADGASEVKKGSDNALIGTGLTAQYLEMAGSGPKAARELAEDLRKNALEVAQCVLEHPDTAQRTATEVERAYSSMLAKADVLREQYGERCVKPLIEMMVAAARKVAKGVRNGDRIERGAVVLPDRVEVKDGNVTRTRRRLGPGGNLLLQWPGYFEPGPNDVALAVRSAADAKAGGLIDQEHASKFVAEYFRVEDVQAMLKKMLGEMKRVQEEREAQMMGRLNGFSAPNGFGGDQ